MQSEKKRNDAEMLKTKYSKPKFWAVILVICVLVLIIGGVLAKYVSSNQNRAEMESARFHISSNYLKEGNDATYSVVEWGDGFDILLYNYETENTVQLSQVDMRYTVTATNATVRVDTQLGDTIEQENGEYLFGKVNTAAYHVLHVTPDSNIGKDGKIVITVQTTKPYRKTLTAEFTLQGKSKPDYTAVDKGDGTILITVQTNDYHGSINVAWDPGKYSPDNTNVLMSSWKDSSPTGDFTVDSNSTYELLFFKNTNDTYSGTNGTGTEITLS